ncbi:MAG: hypothetical protein NTW08_05775 [Gammaproteobacteria bacterium]|nr:hypothetical protein [Gammaproteobacteria bacterium]
MSEKGTKTIIKLLVDFGAPVNEAAAQSLIKNKDLDNLALFFEKGLKASEKMLEEATNLHEPELNIVKMLLSQHIQPTQAMLISATLRSGQYPLVQLFLQQGMRFKRDMFNVLNSMMTQDIRELVQQHLEDAPAEKNTGRFFPGM